MSNLKVAYEIVGSVEKRSWLPRKCFISRKNLFLKKCTCLKTELERNGKTAKYNFWMNSFEYTMLSIKGE